MTNQIIVIGGGPGGYVAAIRAAALGGSVTLIEKDHLGGTCLNYGCIPSKIMKNTADIFHKFSNAGPLGITVQGSVTPDIPTLLQKKEKIIATQRKGISALLKKRGVTVEKGHACITSATSVEVTKAGEKKKFSYNKLIIAAGTKPLNVPDFPFDHNRILSSDDILNLDHVPESMVIVGGGVIGCEFAFIFSSLGARVTIVEAMSRLLPLPSVDEECSKILLREMKKRKIRVLCDTIVASAVGEEEKVTLALAPSPITDNPKPKKLKKTGIDAEKMVCCIGRTALSDDLGLGNINLGKTSRGWIEVDEFLETAVKNVYAIGDILGPEKVMLAHVASHEGVVAAENAMGKSRVMAYDVVPGAIFTMPEIGTVGLSELEAKKKGMGVETFISNFRTLGKAQAIDEIAGMVKMIIEKETRKILGVHMIGAHATDLIAEATLAVQKGLTADDLANTIHAHPTLAEIMGEVSLKAVGTPIHG